MHITDIPTVTNFNGRYSGQAEVLKRSYLYREAGKGGVKGKFKLIGYKPVGMNVVEVDKKEVNDEGTMNMLRALWGRKTVLNNIMLSYDNWGGDRIFCLTTQERGFDKLKPFRIQGVLQVIDGVSCDSIEVERVQSKPSQKYKRGFEKIPFIDRAIQYLRKYHGIGKGLMDFADGDIARGRKIELFALKRAIPFYEKYGFKHDDGQFMSKEPN